MGDYYPGEIEIGGKLPETLLDDFITVIANSGVAIGKGYDEGGCNENEARTYIAERAAQGLSLEFSDPQARNGSFEALEGFCNQHDLNYVRHSDAKYEYDAEIVWARADDNELHTVKSDNNGNALLDVGELRNAMQSSTDPAAQLAAVKQLLDEADPPTVPPIVIVKED